MLEFSAALSTALGNTTTKLAWSNAFIAALGSARRLVCTRNGTPFIDVALSGAITTAGGNITGFGKALDATVQQAADLSTGTCLLRIEGNGNYVQGTLGLPGSGADFIMPSNPTASSGVGFASSASINAPALMPSGTGFVAPPDYAKTPATVTIEDWSSGTKGAEQVITFNDRRADFVYDDPDLATEMGDVLVKFSTQSATLGDIEFGAILWGMNEAVNSESNVPVYEVLILQKPTENNWPNFPAFSGYNQAVSNTFSRAHKIVIRAIDGTILETHQMRDGKPINDPSLNQSHVDIANRPLRPFLHCAGAIPWRSHRPKMNTKANEYYPPVIDSALDPKLAKTHFGTNPIIPAVAFRVQLDGVSSFCSMPKWSIAGNQAALDAMVASVQDQWLYYIPAEAKGFGAIAQGANGMVGWGDEIGAIGGHDLTTGPGGIRNDRSDTSQVYTIHLTNRNYVRPFNNDPIIDMVDAYANTEYYLPNFFVTDVKKGATIPIAEVFSNQWGHGYTWYGSGTNYTDGGAAKCIPMFAIANGQTEDGTKEFFGAPVDKNGLMPWGGANPDMLHNYWSFAPQTLAYNSPMATYAQKHRFISNVLCQLENISDTRNPRDWFLVRQHAWRWKHLVDGWKTSSGHDDLGVKRALYEKRLENEMNAMYDYCVAPSLAPSPTDDYHRCLKFLGLPLKWTDGAGAASHSMTYYLTSVLQRMRATGLWDVMYNKSAKCAAVLDFIIRCMDLCTIDFILDTWGNENYLNPFVGSKYATPLDLATSWADYTARVDPRVGVQDWTTRPDGSKTREMPDDNRYASMHLRYQYVCWRRDYASDIPCARTNGIALACAEYERHYADKRAACANLDRGANGGTNWIYLTPNLAAFKPPVAQPA